MYTCRLRRPYIRVAKLLILFLKSLCEWCWRNQTITQKSNEKCVCVCVCTFLYGCLMLNSIWFENRGIVTNITATRTWPHEHGERNHLHCRSCRIHINYFLFMFVNEANFVIILINLVFKWLFVKIFTNTSAEKQNKTKHLNKF